MKISIFLLSSFIFTMCNSSTKETDLLSIETSLQSTYYDNGNLKRKCKTINDKELKCTEHYSSGKIKKTTHTEENKGYREETTITYFKNGGISSKNHSKNYSSK